MIVGQSYLWSYMWYYRSINKKKKKLIWIILWIINGRFSSYTIDMRSEPLQIPFIENLRFHREHAHFFSIFFYVFVNYRAQFCLLNLFPLQSGSDPYKRGRGRGGKKIKQIQNLRFNLVMYMGAFHLIAPSIWVFPRV